MNLETLFLYLVLVLKRVQGDEDNPGLHTYEGSDEMYDLLEQERTAVVADYEPKRQIGNLTAKPRSFSDARSYGTSLFSQLRFIADEFGSLWNDTLTGLSSLAEDESLFLAKAAKLQSTADMLTSFPFKCPQKRNASQVPVGIMKGSERLFAEEQFCSTDGQSCLYLRHDGNLILYNTTTKNVTWTSGSTQGHCTAILKLWDTGNVGVYAAPPGPLFTGQTTVDQVIWSAPADACQKQQNKDIVGQDIGYYAGKHESQCCQICLESVACKAWTWKPDPRKPTCNFKNAIGPVVDAPGSTLGIREAASSGMEFKFENDGHLCLKQISKAVCRWSTRTKDDNIYARS